MSMSVMASCSVRTGMRSCAMYVRTDCAIRVHFTLRNRNHKLPSLQVFCFHGESFVVIIVRDAIRKIKVHQCVCP